MLPAPPYKTGDVVRLKTGGPPMNVTDSNDFTQEVFCQWFAGDQLQTAKFLCATVELVPQQTSPVKQEVADDPPEENGANGWGAVGALLAIAILFVTLAVHHGGFSRIPGDGTYGGFAILAGAAGYYIGSGFCRALKRDKNP